MSKKIGRATAFATFWRVFRQSRRPGSPSIGQLLAAVPRMIKARFTGQYQGLSYGRLAAFGLAVGYVVSPIDLMPEALLFVLGTADDAFVVVWLVGALLADVERFLDWERERYGVIPGEVLYRSTEPETQSLEPSTKR